jgi:hypothetical protein
MEAGIHNVLLFIDSWGQDKVYNKDILENCHKARSTSSQALKKILVAGVGLGLTKKKPMKSAPLVHWIEGSYLTSMELADNVPAELVNKSILW